MRTRDRTPRPALAARLLAYQRERFPLAAYLPLISVSAVSAAAWSAAARGDSALPPAPVLTVGAASAVVYFLLLRVADEHKDAALDRVARPELPVPRGLITLGELRGVAVVAGVAAIAANAVVAPRLLVALAVAGGWAALMTREFFAADWLRARPAAYLLSHMVAMPLLFVYLTGLDWLAAGTGAPPGLAAFLGLAFGNGILVEVGRKVRAPQGERPGVETYSAAWGPRAAAIAWIATLAAAAGCAWLAAGPTGSAARVAPFLAAMVPIAAFPALGFLRAPTPRAARGMETSAGLWTLASYLLLALAPRIG